MAEVPKEWKPAGAGEEELDWMFYDMESSTTNASTKLVFFDQTESADSLDETNMQTAGQLPQSQRFLVKEIHVLYDPNAAADDVGDVEDGATLELKINNKRVLVGPLAMFKTSQTYYPPGVTTEVHYPVGQPFKLDRYIVINGGVPFSVEVVTGNTTPSAAVDIYVVLRGRLVRPAG